MAANEYSKYTPQQNYSPESFKDLSYAPLMMRERHDRLLNEQDKQLLELENLQGIEQATPYLNQKREEIKAQVEALSNKLNAQGAGNPNLMNEFRNAKRAYNSEVSLSGGIGKIVQQKKDIDAMKDNYYKFGLTQGWTPEKIAANYQKDLDDYLKGFDPNKIGERDYNIPKFEPKFAPKYMGPMDIIKPISDMVGSIKKKWGHAKLEIGTDPITGGPVYGIRTPNNEFITNEPELQALSNYVHKTLMNPASPEMEVLRYGNIGTGKTDEQMRQEFTDRADEIILGVMRDTSRTETSTLNPFSGGGDYNYGGGSGGSGPKEEKTLLAGLNSLDTGKDTFSNADMGKIMSGEAVREYERLESQPGGLTEDQAAKKNLAIQQEYTIARALKDPKVVAKVNEALKDNPLLRQGKEASKLDGYQNTIKAYNERLNNFKENNEADMKLSSDYRAGRVYQGVGFTELPQGIRERVANGDRAQISIQKQQEEINTLTKKVGDAMKGAIGQDMLQFSKMYNISFGDDSNKLSEIMNKGAQRLADDGSVFTLLENFGGDFSHPDYGLTDANNEDALKELKTARDSGNMKLKTGAFYDLGSTGDSKIGLRYEYTTPEGIVKTGDIFLNYNNKSKDSSVLDQYITELQSNMNPTAKAVLQSFKDNKQYKGLDVDSRTGSTYVKLSDKGFSASQDKKIKQFSNDVTKELKLADGRTAEQYKNINYIKPEGTYNMYANEDGFYEMEYKKSTPSKEFYSVSTEQWINREMFRLSKDPNSRGRMSQPDINKVSSDQEKSQHVAETVSMVMDLMDPAQPIIQVGGAKVNRDGTVNPNSINFEKMRRQYLIDIDDNKQNVAVQFEITKQFLKEIGSMRIAHRNKKRFL